MALLISVVLARIGYADPIIDIAIIGAIWIALTYSDLCSRDVSKVEHYVRHITEPECEAPKLVVLKDMSGIIEAFREVRMVWHSGQLQLQQRQLEFGLLFNIIPDPVIALDHDRRIVRSNGAGHRVFGGNTVGKNIFEVINSKIFSKFMEGVEGHSIELDFMEKVGAFYSVSMHKFPKPTAGTKFCDIELLLLLRDVTDYKLRERINSDFIANISHEVRTPLTAIYGFIETMQQENLDKETTAQFLQIMSSQCTRMTSLISDMARLYVLDVQRQYSDDVVSLAVIVDDVIRDAMLQLRSKDMEIIIDASEDSLLVNGSKDDIYSIIMNIVGNAIKYCDGKAILHILCKREGSNCVLSFIDDGPGIPTSSLSRLTERFYRVDSSRSSTIPGTGLGLAIVKSILDRLGGKLEIKSTLGKGSEFIVKIPAAVNEVTSAEV